MLIAQRLRKENIAEYLLYMWQVEDMIRANSFDIGKIDENLISGFSQSEQVKQEIRDWYANLILMMKNEGLVQQGHTSICNDLLMQLTQLHKELLKSCNQSEYIEVYYHTLPFIVELRAKSGQENVCSEIETSFMALYAFLLMNLGKQTISGETQAAISQISNLIRLLSKHYQEKEQNKLKL